VTTDLGALSEEAGDDVLVQPDGRIVVAASPRFESTSEYRNPSSELVVLRYLSDGKLDPGFAAGGVLHVPSEPGGIGSTYFGVAGLGLARDDTIFVGGETGVTYRASNTAAIARVRPDGSLDRIASLAGVDWDAAGVSAMSLDKARGRLYLAGSMPRGPNARDNVMYVAGVRTDDLAGDQPYVALDSRFGKRGLARANFPGTPQDGAASVISDRRGRVVLAGAATDEAPRAVSTPPPRSRAALARFTPAGKLDRRFGQHGLVRVRFPYRQSVAQRVLEHPAGRLVVASLGAEQFSFGYPPTGCGLSVARLAAR
jgi:uncharacterized delta-60 repeat protein